MSSPKMRILLAAIVAVVWIGWAMWSNVPHFYDIEALRQELAVTMPNATVEPSSAGFPFGYMRYEYSKAGQFLPVDWNPSAALPNALFCLTGIAGAILLVFRIRRITIGLVALIFMMLVPATALYFLLNGLHPDVIAYLYLTPLALFLILQVFEKVQNKGVRQSADDESSWLTPSIVGNR